MKFLEFELNPKIFFMQGLQLLQEESGDEEEVMLMVQVKMQSSQMILMWFTLEVVALFWLLTEETRQFARSNFTMKIVPTSTMVVFI